MNGRQLKQIIREEYKKILKENSELEPGLSNFFENDIIMNSDISGQVVESQMEELLNTVSNDIEKTLSSAPDRQKAKVAIRNIIIIYLYYIST